MLLAFIICIIWTFFSNVSILEGDVAAGASNDTSNEIDIYNENETEFNVGGEEANTRRVRRSKRRGVRRRRRDE